MTPTYRPRKSYEAVPVCRGPVILALALGSWLALYGFCFAVASLIERTGGGF